MLFEAADFSTGENLLKAIQRGQAGISPKKYLVGFNFEEKNAADDLKKIIDVVKPRIAAHNFNKAIMLILKKLGNATTISSVVGLRSNFDTFNQWLDILQAYFSNKDKQEFKTNPTAKKLKQDFENNPYDFTKDKKLENWITKNLAQKQQIKDLDKEITKVYDDGTWEVVIPKTYAAANKYACMADRKARWCTSASAAMFTVYTNKENPLYIIRSDKKDKMFQMDWGEKGDNYGYPNFMDENDRPMKYTEFLKEKVPGALLKAIKDSNGKSVYDKIIEHEKKLKDEDEKQKAEETEKEIEKGWVMRKIAISTALKELERFSLSLSSGSKLDYDMASVLGKVYNRYNQKPVTIIYKITGNGKIYYLMNGEIKLPGKQPLSSLLIEVFLKTNRAIKRNPFAITRLKGIPDKIKRTLVGAGKEEEIEVKYEIIFNEDGFKIIKPGNVVSFSKFLTRNQYQEKVERLKATKDSYSNFIIVKGNKKTTVLDVSNIYWFYYFNFPKKVIEKILSLLKEKSKKELVVARELVDKGYKIYMKDNIFAVLANEESFTKALKAMKISPPKIEKFIERSKRLQLFSPNQKLPNGNYERRHFHYVGINRIPILDDWYDPPVDKINEYLVGILVDLKEKKE